MAATGITVRVAVRLLQVRRRAPDDWTRVDLVVSLIVHGQVRVLDAWRPHNIRLHILPGHHDYVGDASLCKRTPIQIPP